ncbi:hypothetical protein RM543_15105 [Roseicyclus sp. F158]|uniref:Alpha/beta hydrolase n=1 Tax=Tropicimonas omnivorans TaxID=3075590 RepID=A0ABU3DJY8_9RHOB|nr:hypothetical protein [Roseicyclus sp. F158]MDT0684017.1 hypothetical protein [Roseicyclus sp. F158]
MSDAPATLETTRGDRAVRRRTVFYIPGFDPFHPRRYRELYRKEGAAQAAIAGYELRQAQLPGSGGVGWTVQADIEGERTEAEIRVLVWADIVKASMGTGIARTYLDLCRTAWTYIASGALGRLMRLRKGPVIAALYPVAVLLGQLLIACAVAAGIGALLSLAAAPLAWLGILAMPPVLMWFRSHDNRIFAYYLMHDYAFTAQYRGANPPALEARMAGFREAIEEALRGDADEVLVVGHSSGAHIGVSVLADLVRGGGAGPEGPALSFLSLGQVIPMVSFLPDAERLREDLRCLSQQGDIAWIDVTAPGDGCAFALCDPVAVSGVAGSGKRWPLVLSAAFTQTLSPERWSALRWRFFRLHFQYLCAFDRPGDYDYFRITAGPRTLAARFAHRAPSASRIETPVSPHVRRRDPQIA